MHQLTLKGTPDAMGQQHGAMMAQIGLSLPPELPQNNRLTSACEAIAAEFTPAFVAEMRAFAAAANVPYADLKALLLTGPLYQTMPSCSVVAILPQRSADGKLRVGRNYDFGYAVSWDGATTYATYPAAGHAHLGNCDIWIGREDGLNAAGLFVAMSATFVPGVQPGLPFWFIVRHLLETCTNVDEARAWIQRVPHAQSRNYMLADSARAVVVEASTDGVYIREPEDGLLIMTNHPLHPALRDRVAMVPPDSPTRYQRLEALPARSVAASDLEHALNDRPSGLCAHGTIYGQPYGTIWSVIGVPADRQLAIATGTGDNQGTMAYRSMTL